jgi:hypothetical protein
MHDTDGIYHMHSYIWTKSALQDQLGKNVEEWPRRLEAPPGRGGRLCEPIGSIFRSDGQVPGLQVSQENGIAPRCAQFRELIGNAG